MNDKFIENIFYFKNTLFFLFQLILSFFLYFYLNIGLWIFIMDILFIPDILKEIRTFFKERKNNEY
jgi:hypothetical protein